MELAVKDAIVQYLGTLEDTQDIASVQQIIGKKRLVSDLYERKRFNEMKILKNIDLESVLNMADLVTYQPGQIVSRTLVQNKTLSMTLFAFDANEEISSHESKGDALVYILDGSAAITIGGNGYTLSAGQTIVMPAGIPHAVEAPTPFKMLLIVVFPSETNEE